MKKNVTEKPISPELERAAARRATERANSAKWSLEVAIFLFAVLIIVVILLFEGFSVEIVGPVALVGLALVWVIGWRQGKRMYKPFFDEEVQLLRQKMKEITTVEDTIEEQIQKVFRQRWSK